MKKDKKNLFILIIVIICVIVLSYLLFFSGITNKLKASVNGLVQVLMKMQTKVIYQL